MVKDDKRRIAVIGVGGWGKNHVRVLHEMGVLGAICDEDQFRAKELARVYESTPYYSLDQLLQNEPDLDGCVVCTPTKTHFAIAKKILTSGYIERFNPAIQDVKRLIDDRKYGDLLMMEFHRENRMPLHIRDVGIIYDTSVHDIDTAMYLFNSTPHVVFARSGTKFHSYEDFATIMLGFGEQRVAIIASNWITPNRVRKFSAVCTDGIITGDYITQGIKIDYGDATIIPRRGKFQEPLTLELQSFLDVVAGKMKEPVVTPEDATNVTKVAEAALLSSNTGSPIYMDLKYR
jgi:UDP-N-acetylglucosamine 3-dehydrogenase